jgi:2-C-methyl-D-erythritol 2,4-cyclodiphosphate synthase
MRIGQGSDVHALVEGRKLVIGGVTIPFGKGLGAAALGDIGRHFPDTDPKYTNADSRAFLREVAGRVRDAGYAIANLDATIHAEAPKMAPHIGAMIANLAADLGLPAGRVNVKAKTAERLGAIGRGEGIAAEAIVLLEPRA